MGHGQRQVIVTMSADPARIWAAMAAASRTVSPRRPPVTARSAARRTQGIHAAPAKWCQTLTSASNGPESIHSTAATRPAPLDRPRRGTAPGRPGRRTTGARRRRACNTSWPASGSSATWAGTAPGRRGLPASARRSRDRDPQGPRAAQHRAHECLHLSQEDEVDVPLVEDLAAEDHLPEQRHQHARGARPRAGPRGARATPPLRPSPSVERPQGARGHPGHQGSRRDVGGDHGARGHEGPGPDGDPREQGDVRAHEGPAPRCGRARPRRGSAAAAGGPRSPRWCG